MSANKTIFVIECGEYSDRYIVGAFSSKRKAESFLEISQKIRGKSCRLIEVSFNQISFEKWEDECYIGWDSQFNFVFFLNEEERDKILWSGKEALRLSEDRFAVRLLSFVSDGQAKKVAQDKVAQLKAEEQNVC